MRSTTFRPALLALCLTVLPLHLPAQTFTVPPITFEGAPAYSQADLLKVTGLTPGSTSTQDALQAAAQRGRGVGTKLLLALLPHAQRLGKHTLIGGVDAENTASVRFHERLGFERVGHLRQVGFKFDRWLDLILLQRHI